MRRVSEGLLLVAVILMVTGSACGVVSASHGWVGAVTVSILACVLGFVASVAGLVVWVTRRRRRHVEEWVDDALYLIEIGDDRGARASIAWAFLAAHDLSESTQSFSCPERPDLGVHDGR